MALALQGVVRVGRFVNSVVFGRSNLLLTNALISTAMGALGDCIQQHYDLLMNEADPTRKKRDIGGKPADTSFNWTRTAHMSACGLTTGLVTHFWYVWLDKKLGVARAIKPVMQKVLVDQIFFSPVNLTVYFGTLGICEQSSLSYVKDELWEKGIQNIYLAEWFIWPPAQVFNFYCLPLRYRILFDNIVSLGFDIYSPYVKYKTELKKEREATAKALREAAEAANT